MEEKVVNKIRNLRIKKGYTYENMAFDLDISPSAYRKIETHQTKLTVERLIKISEILEVDLEEILNIKPKNIYNQQIGENSSGYQDIKNLYAENQRTIDKLIEQFELRLKEKDDFISILRQSQK